MVYFLLTFSIVTLCLGQIFLKMGSANMALLPNIFHLAFRPIFILALATYGVSMLSWIYVLQHMPLSRAYMFVSFAFIIIPVLSHFLFKESLNIQFFMGAALIISGVILTFKS